MSRERLHLPPFPEFGFLKQAYQRKGRLGAKPRHRLGETLNPAVYFLSETRWMWQKQGFRSPLRPLIFYARERLSSGGKNDWCTSMRIYARAPKPIQKANHYSVVTPGQGRKKGDGRVPGICWPDLVRSGFKERFDIKWRAIEKDVPDWTQVSTPTCTHGQTHRHTHT